jgi:hypothetical protein
MVFTYAFFQELSREAQSQAKILTDLAGSPVFTLVVPTPPDETASHA